MEKKVVCQGEGLGKVLKEEEEMIIMVMSPKMPDFIKEREIGKYKKVCVCE